MELFLRNPCIQPSWPLSSTQAFLEVERGQGQGISRSSILTFKVISVDLFCCLFVYLFKQVMCLLCLLFKGKICEMDSIIMRGLVRGSFLGDNPPLVAKSNDFKPKYGF